MHLFGHLDPDGPTGSLAPVSFPFFIFILEDLMGVKEHIFALTEQLIWRDPHVPAFSFDTIWQGHQSRF